MEGIAKLVLDPSVDMNAINGQGCGPLYLPIYYRNRKLSRLLIRWDCRILVRTDELPSARGSRLNICFAKATKSTLTIWCRDRVIPIFKL